jgi:hypothetical protein
MDRVDEAAAFCREAIKTRKPGGRERAYEAEAGVIIARAL